MPPLDIQMKPEELNNNANVCSNEVKKFDKDLMYEREMPKDVRPKITYIQG